MSIMGIVRVGCLCPPPHIIRESVEKKKRDRVGGIGVAVIALPFSVGLAVERTSPNRPAV